MRVLLDSRLAVRGLGIGKTVNQLSAALQRYEDLEISRWEAPEDSPAGATLGTLWRSGLFDVSPSLDLRVRGAHVVHFMSNMVAAFPTSKSVLTIHDLMFLNGRSARDRMVSRLFALGAHRCGAVVCTSASTWDELRTFDPQVASRSSVIPWGRSRTQVRPGQVRDHLLAFGALHARKRSHLLPGIYARYLQLAGTHVPLVVLARAGVERTVAGQLEDLGATVISGADDAQARELLAGARALVMTSSHEGWGLPVVEAAEVGTPVVLGAEARFPCEVVGPHCVRASGEDPLDWARAIAMASEMSFGDVRLDVPMWHEVADRYYELYEAVQ